MALLSHHCLLSAGSSASHLPLVRPAGWLLHLLLSHHLCLALRRCLRSTRHMSLTFVSHRNCCLSSSLPPIISRRLTLPPPPILSHRFHFPSLADPLVNFTSHQPPVISWRLSSLASMLIVTSLWRLCCPYHCGCHLAVVLFVALSTDNRPQAVAPVLAFDAAS